MNLNNSTGGYDSEYFNSNNDYDLFNKNPFYFHFKDLLESRNNICSFFDEKSFCDEFSLSIGFLCINSNIQSISSFTALTNFLDTLKTDHIFIPTFLHYKNSGK